MQFENFLIFIFINFNHYYDISIMIPILPTYTYNIYLLNALFPLKFKGYLGLSLPFSISSFGGAFEIEALAGDYLFFLLA